MMSDNWTDNQNLTFNVIRFTAEYLATAIVWMPHGTIVYISTTKDCIHRTMDTVCKTRSNGQIFCTSSMSYPNLWQRTEKLTITWNSKSSSISCVYRIDVCSVIILSLVILLYIVIQVWDIRVPNLCSRSRFNELQGSRVKLLMPVVVGGAFVVVFVVAFVVVFVVVVVVLPDRLQILAVCIMALGKLVQSCVTLTIIMNFSAQCRLIIHYLNEINLRMEEKTSELSHAMKVCMHTQTPCERVARKLVTRRTVVPARFPSGNLGTWGWLHKS